MATMGGIVVASQTVKVASNGTATTFLSIFAKLGAYKLTYAYNGDANHAATTTTASGAITYGIQAAPPVKIKAGATVTLTDAFGLNAGSSGTAVTATGISSAASPNTALALPPGTVAKFAYASGVYTLNLKTTGLAAGTYLLYFTAAGDSVVHSLQFVLN